MKAQDKLQILNEVVETGYKKLESEILGTESATTLLTNLHQAEVLMNTLQITAYEENVREATLGKLPDAPTVTCSEASPVPNVDTENALRPVASVDEPDEEQKERMKAATRSELARLSAACPNLNVSAVMADMGYSKLSDVPWDRYDELLSRTRELAGEM